MRAAIGLDLAGVLSHLDALLKRGHQGFVAALHGQGDPEIDALLTQYLGMPPAEFPAASFTDTRGPVFSVWQTLLERLGPFRRAGVLDLMSGSDFAAEDLLKPCTLYLAWPEADLDADAKPLALILNYPSNPTAYTADLDFYREVVAGQKP